MLSVKMNDQDVMFSPFALNINPNVPAVSSSVTTGSGLSQGVTGIVYDIYVQARDAALNNQLDSQVRVGDVVLALCMEYMDLF